MDTIEIREKAARTAQRRILGPSSIKSLPAPETGTAEYFDEETPGMSLRVTSHGTRTWSLLYRNPQGRQRRLTLGQYDQKCGLKEARKLAGDARAALRDGKDPAELKQVRRTAITVDDLFQKWLEIKGLNLKRKAKEEQRMFEADFKSWKPRNADEITKEDVHAIVDAKLKHGFKTAALATKKLVSRLYSFGIERNLVSRNPVLGVKVQKPKGRQRVLAEEEIVRMWTACDPELEIPTKGLGTIGRRQAIKLHLSVWFKLRLVTLQRGGEIMMMRWQDLQKQHHWWVVPGAFTKNGYDHTVYLNATARALIATLPKLDPVWIFPAGDTTNRKGDLVPGSNTSKLNVMGDHKHLARRIAQPTRADIVLSGHEPGERCIPGFTGHDLRRTATTILARGGVPRELTKKILNHAEEENEDVTAIYDRYAYQAEKKAIFDFWDRQLTAILAGEPISTVGRIDFSNLPVE
jgi:integrase